MWVIVKYKRDSIKFECVQTKEVIYDLDNISNSSYLKAHSDKIFELKRDGNVILTYYTHKMKDTIIYGFSIEHLKKELTQKYADRILKNYNKILEDVRAINLEKI